MAGHQNQNQNVDLFDTYFRRADLDHDGRISGAEAVGFFQGSNLSKQILAQIWMHADQSHTGFLGRQEFYNFLKLVTVVQSKRDLTPEIVKAALYGPASAKIPAPQMNFVATPVPQVNSRLPTPQMNLAPSPVPQVNSRPNAPSTQVNSMPPSSPLQMGAGAQMSSQTYGFRGQVPPNPGINPQYFPPQGNQFIRPPVPMPSGNDSRPSQDVAGSNIPQGGVIAGASHSNPSLSTDWIGVRTGGSPSAASFQIPHRGISPQHPSVGQKPPDALSMSAPVVANSPNSSVGQGNGFSSNSMFGGDMFSVNPLAPKQVTSSPTYSASMPGSFAIVPVTSGAQPSPKIDPLESLNAFTTQSAGGELPASQPVLKPNQSYSSQNNNTLGSSGSSVDIGNSTSQQEPSWPKMTRAGIQRYHKVFVEVDTDRDGRITGDQARNLFLSWRLPRDVLKQVWDLSDQDHDSMLTLREFCIALFLMERYREGQQLPATLPSSVILDETLLSLAGPPTTSFGTSTWGSNPGLRPQQGMPGPQSMTPGGPRPPTPSGFSMPDGNVQFNQQKRDVTSMENSNMGHLGNGDHNLSVSRDQKEIETENKVEKEKMLLDSKEKMVFYREKMQDLILFKSRCDNRLNEITERAIADKRESESLGKKYEEKYKQVAEIASKLTIEEAAFRDIQERKMEYHQAIMKMEQGGSADGILQVRADRIQSDLEELLKALTERCKKHGVHVKSAAVIELPRGWHPGIPENSAVWDEEWDKFDDEGFSFDVAVATDAKSASHIESSSPIDGFSPGSLSNADDRSNIFNKFDHMVESESAHIRGEDESMRSPTSSPARLTAFDSPARQTAFDSPSHDYSDEHSRKRIDANTEAQRSFDERNWGTFDNNDDTDSVWGFSSMNAKDPDHEKHGEKYFFESSEYGGSPVKTDSPQADGMFQKKSPFRFEDSVPISPISRAGNSPRYSDGLGDQFFNNMSRYDSFSVADGDSSRRESFARFDSMSSTSGFDHSRGFSFDDSDPFGSSGPFKVSSERETPKKGSDNWNAF